MQFTNHLARETSKQAHKVLVLGVGAVPLVIVSLLQLALNIYLSSVSADDIEFTVAIKSH